MKPELPAVEVGQRFTVDGMDRLPPVALVRKLPTTWLVSEIRTDGTVDRAHFRLTKGSLFVKTVRILRDDFKPEPAAEAGRPIQQQHGERLLTTDEFHRLKDVPPEAEWFANISSAHTRRAYKNDVKSFMAFVGIERPDEGNNEGKTPGNF